MGINPLSAQRRLGLANRPRVPWLPLRHTVPTQGTTRPPILGPLGHKARLRALRASTPLGRGPLAISATETGHRGVLGVPAAGQHW